MSAGCVGEGEGVSVDGAVGVAEGEGVGDGLGDGLGEGVFIVGLGVKLKVVDTSGSLAST